MGIRVRHEGDIAATGQGSYLAGLGNLARYYIDRGDKYELQKRGFQQQSGMQAREIAARQQMAQMQMQAQAQAQADQFNRQTALAELGQANRMEYGQANVGWQKDLMENQYTAKQQAQQEQLRNGMAQVDQMVASGDVTEDWGAEMKMRLSAAQFGIKPPPRFMDKPKSLDDQISERVKQNEDGSAWIVQPDGKITFQPPDPNKYKAELAEQQRVAKQQESDQKAQDVANDNLVNAAEKIGKLYMLKATALTKLKDLEGKTDPAEAKKIEELYEPIIQALSGQLSNIQGQIQRAAPPQPQQEVPQYREVEPQGAEQNLGDPRTWAPEMMQTATQAMRAARQQGITDREKLRQIGIAAAQGLQ